MPGLPAESSARPTNGAVVGTAVGSATVGVGAAVTATLAGVCCTGPVIAPIVVGILGASGAAAAAGLKPYTLYLFAASAILLAIGVYSVRNAIRKCTLGAATSARPTSLRVANVVLWVGAVIWIASAAFTLYATSRAG